MLPNRRTLRILLVMVSVSCCVFNHPICAHGDDATTEIGTTKPLWEAGLFNVVARLPHYRGSDEATIYAFPLPYLIYRGDFFRVNREGIKGVFLHSEFFEFDTSLYGNPPVDKDNRARSGMEELDPLVEIGPSLKWFPFGRNPNAASYLKAAIRGAASIDFPGDLGIQYQGLHGELDWIHQVSAPFGYRNWIVGSSLGLDFTNSDYNRYFYDVTAGDARDGRPVYHSEGGYAGAKLSVYAGNILNPNLTLWTWFRWENIDGAVFENSPLVMEKNNFSFSLALTWTIFRSERSVTRGVDVYSE